MKFRLMLSGGEGQVNRGGVDLKAFCRTSALAKADAAGSVRVGRMTHYTTSHLLSAVGRSIERSALQAGSAHCTLAKPTPFSHYKRVARKGCR